MTAAFDPASFDWNLLRVLGAVIEDGSLTAAARRLGSSQPTLSRQLRALEAALGAPLFERTARRLKPSATALALAEPAARMAAAAQACAFAAHDAAARAGSLAGTVRLTASQVVSAHVLPPVLADLARKHPEVQVELVARDTLDNLLEREADIAVRMVRPTQGALITRHLADWPLGFYVHRDLLAGDAVAPTPDRLDTLRWIGMDQQTTLVDGFRAAGYAIDRRFFGLRCDNPLVDLEAVRAGVGVGLLLQPLARRLPELQPVLPGLPLPVLPVWLTAHRELRTSRRLRVVFDALAAALREWGDTAAGDPGGDAPTPAPALSAPRRRRSRSR